MKSTYAEIDPSVLDLPLARVAFKTSHNAYEIDKVSLADQMNWSVAHPEQGGCRGMEFDVHQEQKDSASWRWSVSHDGSYDTDPDNQLGAYLRAVGRWSVNIGETHGPMLIHIDLKDTFGDDAKFPDQIDAYIRGALPNASFVTASDVLGTAPSLLDAITSRKRWPTIRETQGRILVCLTGGQDSRTKTYIASMLSGKERLCFCDREITGQLSAGAPIRVADEPNRLILNFDMMSGDCRPPIKGSIDGLESALLRAYALPPSLWSDAVDAGANLLAMDILKFGSCNVSPPLYAPAAGR